MIPLAVRRVWAIGDLHLSGARPKPMDVFGPAWRDHPARIAAAWRYRVAAEDLVIVPGDISWAMTLEEARPDLAWISALPGTKLLLRGNHDYWWSGLAKVRRAAPDLLFLQNDAIAARPFIIAGTRGWDIPPAEGGPEMPREPGAEATRVAAEAADDERIYRRECERLRLSLAGAARIRSDGIDRLIAALHFPPLYAGMESSGFTGILDAHGPEAVVYGHLHGEAAALGFAGARRGARYVNASADAIDFAPILIAEA
ncbi:MAG: metallophosphoesterase [Planctomycetes bacterium]|nr:metallophosphoesterase [Planctomycetota bacterium]